MLRALTPSSWASLSEKSGGPLGVSRLSAVGDDVSKSFPSASAGSNMIIRQIAQ